MQQKPRKRHKEASKHTLLRAGLIDVLSKYGCDPATIKIGGRRMLQPQNLKLFTKDCESPSIVFDEGNQR